MKTGASTTGTLRAAVAVVLAVCGTAAAADKNEPLPTFEETCFQARPAASFLPMADARRMLEGIGQDSRLFPGDGNKVRLKGLFRLRDWTPENAVRVALQQGSHLRIHVWGEGHGVSLFLTPAGAAYRITQQPGEALLKQDVRLGLAALLTTDDRRGARLPHAAYQIRCQDRAVVVTKGNIRVMTVPLEGPPKSIYLQVPNDAMLHDLAIFRSGPAPEEISPPHRVVLDGRRPTELPWKATLPKGARFEKSGDGSVEIAVENTADVAMASVAPAGPGLREVVAEFDEATPGTGITFLDAKGEPLDGIEFGREGKSTLAFGFGTPRGQEYLGNFDFVNGPVPLAGPKQWLRLVVAGGSSHCWISGDGIHWGRVLVGHDCYGSWKTIAIYARAANDRTNPDNAARHIRLRSLQVRELGGLTTAAGDLLAKAAAGAAMKADQAESLQAWSLRVASLAPAGPSPAAWRYACAIQALAAPLKIDAAEPLLYRAVYDRLSELRSMRAKIDLLQDAALVWRFREDFARRQLELWERLGREVVNAGSRADFELYQQALVQASLGDLPDRSGPVSWDLARDATILYFADRRQGDVARMMNMITFWRTDDPQVCGSVGEQLDRLLQWLNAHPMRRKPRGTATVTNITGAVTPQLNRAANNILSDLQSMSEERQYVDAARILVASAPPTHSAGTPDEGLVLAPNDDQLFASFPTALRLLMEEHPGLCEAMVRQIGPADRFRIEQALAQGDPATVEALPLQYWGTPIAALPCQWLGDRALAAADLASAIAWYGEGLRWASPPQRPELAAHGRLVSAMLGTAQGQPPTQPISFGSVKVPPQQFEGWVRDQLARRRTAAEAASSADSLPTVAAAQPVQFQAAVFGQPNDSVERGFKADELQYEARGIDWTWRHLTVLGEDSALAVERARITAFDLAGGKVRWDFPLGNGMSPRPVWPLVRGQRIYLRAAVGGDRAGVVCLDGGTGRNLWLRDCGGTAACNPLWCRGRLFVLTIGSAGERFVAPLCLVELDPETGDVISRRQILEINDREKLPSECQVSWAGNRLIVLAAGCVISTDLQGRIIWLRQDATLPYAINPVAVPQNWPPVIESEGRLFVEQPGSWTIDCLASETGQRRWRRSIIGLQSIADLTDNRLLAKTARGLVALNKTTGDVVWQCESPGMLSAFARTTSGLILGARQATVGVKPHLVFFGIDPAMGRTRAHDAVPLEKNQPVLFGPITVRGTGLGGKAWGAVIVSPSVATLGVEEIRGLARRLREAPNPGLAAAAFGDGRRIEGNQASGWRGSGSTIARDGPAQAEARSSRDGLAAEPAPQSDSWLEFHNGDRIRGTICGYTAAATQPGQGAGAQVLVQLPQDSSKPAEKPIAVEADWLRRIVFDAAATRSAGYSPRHCPPRSLVCRDGRVVAFRALRFSGTGVSLLTDQGLARLAYRDLSEVVMPPIDAWEAYQRQLAKIDPTCGADIIRLETGQGMALTVSAAGGQVPEAAGSSCFVRPAWSHTPIPVFGSSVRRIWRAPATVVPLSLFTPQQVTQHGALGSSWKWQVDRSVAGGELRSGGVRCLWGFGVHAPERNGLPPARLCADLPQRFGRGCRRRRFRVCRGESLPQRRVRNTGFPKQAADGLAIRHFHRRYRSCEW